MPKIQFGNVRFTGPLPEGQYTCEIDRVDRMQVECGVEMWRLRWVVHDAPYQGRLVDDTLVFSPLGMPRVKLLCDSLGIDTTGVVDLEPETLLGGFCVVRVRVEERLLQNKVLFDGYAPAPDAEPIDDERWA